MASKKIPDTQIGGINSNTLQPRWIWPQLDLAARTLNPGGSGRMHTVFINFKQATIPTQDPWQHLQRTRMPASLLSII